MIDIDIILLVLKMGIVALLYVFVWRVVRAAVASVRSGVRATGQAPDIPVSAAPMAIASDGSFAGVRDAFEHGDAQPLGLSRSPRLVVESSPSTAVGTAFHLAEELAIGRNPANDVVLNETVVSGRHSRVFLRGRAWLVEDLGSTNGTYVDGVRVSRAELRDGSLLRVGDTVFLCEG